jgi:dipeptidyl aminopeptidase/acylaminoacyl peptidase
MEVVMDWRQRFRVPQMWAAQLAGGRPDRGLLVASQDGSTIQLHAWDVPGGQLTSLTEARHGVATGWLDPTGAYVYYLRDEDGSEIGHLVRVPFEGGEAQDLTPALTPYAVRGVGFDASGGTLGVNPVNDDGYALYVLDLSRDGGEPRLLHRDSWETWGALLSARGDLAACWSTARARGARRYTLLVFDTSTGEQVAELDDGRDASVTGVAFSSVDGDDRLLAQTTRGGLVRPVIWNPRTGERQDVPLPELTGDVTPADWSAETGRVLCCEMAGVQRLYVYDLAEERLTRLDHPQGSYLNVIDGGAKFGPGNTIVSLRNPATAPADVVELDADTGHTRRVLLPGMPGADAPPGLPWRSVTFPSSDGTLVQAWLAAPEGTAPFPTILEVHGGPHYAAYEGYDPGVQCWLDHGYAWLSVNYRGSTGFGRAFLEQIWGDLGRWELADMVAAREWLVAKRIAVPDEIFVQGGSYGGYLTLFALGKRPDLWAGGLAIAADADLVSAYEHCAEALRGALRAWMLGTPAERPQAYAASSPITYAAEVAAPVLVIQARNDTRVPPQQIEDYERRLRSLGKEIEVVWLEGGHQSFGPDTLVHCYETMLAFVERTLTRRRRNIDEIRMIE